MGQGDLFQVIDAVRLFKSHGDVGVEDIELKVDSRNRNLMEITLTVSTFVK